MEDITALLPHSKKEPKVDVARGRQLNEALSELMDLRGCSLCLFFEAARSASSLRSVALLSPRVPSPPHSPPFHSAPLHSISPPIPSCPFSCPCLSIPPRIFPSPNPLSPHSPCPTMPPVFALSVPVSLFPSHSLCHPTFGPVLAAVLSLTSPLPPFLLSLFPSPPSLCSLSLPACLPPDAKAEGPLSLAQQGALRTFCEVSHQSEGASRIYDITVERMSLVEVGPRFCLNPIRVFSGTFGGPTLNENPSYISPNKFRINEKKHGEEYREKVRERHSRETYKVVNALPVEDLAHVWDGKEDGEEDGDEDGEE
ncbi:unnamed protein product [Closterium sp. NIES-53]